MPRSFLRAKDTENRNDRVAQRLELAVLLVQDIKYPSTQTALELQVGFALSGLESRG